MNEYINFIKFALDEFNKIDTIGSINIDKFNNYTRSIEFDIWFDKKGFKSFKIDSWSVSDEDMRKCLKEKIEKFIKKDKELKELEEKKNYYEKELNEIEKQIRDRRENE
jgi:hypothetical protein